MNAERFGELLGWSCAVGLLALFSPAPLWRFNPTRGFPSALRAFGSARAIDGGLWLRQPHKPNEEQPK
jgi:hypothetical protein